MSLDKRGHLYAAVRLSLLYDKDGMSVLKRKYKDEVTVVAINNTKETQKVALPASAIGEKQEFKGIVRR